MIIFESHFELMPGEDDDENVVESIGEDDLLEVLPKQVKPSFGSLFSSNIAQDLGNSFFYLEKSTTFNSAALAVANTAVLFPETGGPLLLASAAGFGFYSVGSMVRALAYGGYKAYKGEGITSDRKLLARVKDDKLSKDLDLELTPELNLSKDLEKGEDNSIKISQEAGAKKVVVNQKDEEEKKDVEEQNRAAEKNKNLAAMIAIVMVIFLASLYAPWALPLVIGMSTPLIANRLEKVIDGGNQTKDGVRIILEGVQDLRQGKQVGVEKIISGAEKTYNSVNSTIKSGEELLNTIEEEKARGQKEIERIREEIYNLRSSLDELKKDAVRVGGGVQEVGGGIGNIASGDLAGGVNRIKSGSENLVAGGGGAASRLQSIVNQAQGEANKFQTALNHDKTKIEDSGRSK